MPELPAHPAPTQPALKLLAPDDVVIKALAELIGRAAAKRYQDQTNEKAGASTPAERTVCERSLSANQS